MANKFPVFTLSVVVHAQKLAFNKLFGSPKG